MSRIGRMPVKIPKGTDVKIEKDMITIKGPKGQLQQKIRHEISIKVEDDKMIFSPINNYISTKALHGLYRSLVNNMVISVTEGYTKTLIINGTGYKATGGKNSINLSLGYSHPIDFPLPTGISAEVEGINKIVLKGIDKQQIGQVAANIRKLRPPEPYKGKGIKYAGEKLRRKVGKAAKAVGTK